MAPSQHSILLEVIDQIADAMDAERAFSQCRRDQLFLRWGEVNELFVPVRYVELGLTKALEHEHPELREAVSDKLRVAIDEITLVDVKACENRAAAESRRPCVLGKKMKNNFVVLDEVLLAVVRAHEEFMRERQQKAHRVFRKFDTNGDGVFDYTEFCAMLAAIEPNAKPDDIDELWRAAGGKGADDKSTLDMTLLEDKLFSIGRLHKVATLKPAVGRKGRNLVETAAAQVAREELSVLVALWDSVRYAPDTEEEKERQAKMDDMIASNWASVMRMKVWLRLRLERWRQHAHDHQHREKAA